MNTNKIEISDNIKIKDNTSEHNFDNILPIKGIIHIYDKDGNLVQTTHNMVVKGGRYLLYGLFVNYGLYGQKTASGDLPTDSFKISSGGGDQNISNFDKGKFSINFSYSAENVRTSADMTFDDVEETITSYQTVTAGGGESTIINESKKLDITNELDSSDLSIEYDVYELKVIFKATITGSTTFQKFNQVYLSYTIPQESSGSGSEASSSSSSDTYLFSRAIMDPVFLGTDGEYSIHYTLYF